MDDMVIVHKISMGIKHELELWSTLEYKNFRISFLQPPRVHKMSF